MSLREKLDARRLLNGAVLIGALVLAWKFETRPAPAAGASGPTAAASTSHKGALRRPWSWWRAVLLETYAATEKDRLLAVAAGVVFYALLAVFPAIAAFVSLYGLFADPASAQTQLSQLSGVLPATAVSVLQEQIGRMTARPSGLGIGFVVGLVVALWSANAGVKAMIDALNVIEGQDERRSFVRFNLLSLSLTLGAIVFLLLAVAAVVAFPLAMSTLGLKQVTAAATWLIRWPVLLALVVAAIAALYRFGPSRDGEPRRWLTLGAVIAAFLWLAGSALLSFYLSHFADYNATYGSLGAAIGLMMWMWLSAIAVLLGAQIDTVIGRKMTAP